MLNEVQFRFRFHVPQIDFLGKSGLLFERWLPIGAQHSISIAEGNKRLEISFDETCWRKAAEKPVDVSGLESAQIENVLVTVWVKDMDSELYAGLQPWNPQLSQPFIDNIDLPNPQQDFALSLARWVFEYINRLLRYARYAKGQWWLKELTIDASDLNALFTNWGASFIKSGQPPVRWHVPGFGGRYTPAPRQRGRSISKEDWTILRSAVVDGRNSSLVARFLADAEQNAYEGHRRSAVIEAVTAIEIACNMFARAPAKIIDTHSLFERIENKSLPKLVDKFGVRGTIAVLLPILLSETQISTEILKDSRDACDVRNNIVHNGQYEVDQERCDRFIDSARILCECLERNTEERTDTKRLIDDA